LGIQVPLSLTGTDSSNPILTATNNDTGGGLRGESTAINGVGVYAIAKTVGLLANVDGVAGGSGAPFTTSAGVSANNQGSDGSAVYASGNGTGVYAIGQAGDGVYGELTSTSTTRAAVHGKQNNSTGLAGYFEGKVKATGDVSAPTFTTSSDRDAKADFASVDGRQTLEQLLAIPVESWSYKSDDPAVRHIGPMAQDFAAAFGVGQDDKHIATVDADGVAFAAIQGLYQVVREKDARIAAQEQRLTALEQQNAALEARLSALEQQAGITTSPRLSAESPAPPGCRRRSDRPPPGSCSGNAGTRAAAARPAPRPGSAP
jgi:hypothetical protein